MPNTKSETGGVPPDGYEKFVIPSGMKSEDEIRIYRNLLQNVVNKEMEIEKKVSEYKEKVEEYKKELEKQGFKNIEIIGIFSAILALLIIDVSIVKSVDSFLAAILLISALTCSIAIFAILIHLFFTPSDKVKFGKLFWIPISILLLFIVFGIVSYFLSLDTVIYSNKTSQPNTLELLVPNSEFGTSSKAVK